jgi:hypothetical protein
MSDITQAETDPRDTLARSIRYAARLATFLSGKPHHPDLDELLKDLVLDIEEAWLLADDGETGGSSDA